MVYNFIERFVMEKLKEFGIFLFIVVAILVLAYFTGFLKGFSVADFRDAYNNITSVVTKGIESTGITNYVNSEASIGNQNTTIFHDYKALPIPKNVLKGHQDSYAWSRVFNSPKKAIFYIYDSENKNKKLSPDFHNQVSAYFNKNNMSRYYNLEPVTLYYFEKLNWGNSGPDKMCNSIQECNEYRQKAANYSLLNEFLRRCGKSMCVINPSNNQYVILKTRNVSEAIKMLNAIKTW